MSVTVIASPIGMFKYLCTLCNELFTPLKGKQLLQISVPVYNVTSCCFGGPNFEWLFVTSACFATDEKEWKQFPHSGGIFVVKNLGTKGLPANRFKQ